MIAFTTSGDESASPTPSSPSSVRTRTSTESWLLAVFAWMFGMRRIWQTTCVIFMAEPRQAGSDGTRMPRMKNKIITDQTETCSVETLSGGGEEHEVVGQNP